MRLHLEKNHLESRKLLSSGHPIKKPKKRISVNMAFLVLALTLFSTTPLFALVNVSGPITSDTTWTSIDSPYIVTGIVTIKESQLFGSPPILTIEPGVEVRFNEGAGIQVGDNIQNGVLRAVGSEYNEILFTSNKTPPAAGDWQGIDFSNVVSTNASTITHCIIEYAGETTGSIDIKDAEPSIEDSTIRLSGTTGITSKEGSFTLSNSTIEQSTGNAVYIENATVDINNNTFSDNVGDYDIYCGDGAKGDITANTMNKSIFNVNYWLQVLVNYFIWNTNNQIELTPNQVGDFLSSNVIRNTDPDSKIMVTGGTITDSATWTNVVPYHIQGEIDVAFGVTLTLKPGANLKFQKGVGNLKVNSGELFAVGKPGEPIIFTSADVVDPGNGDWDGIYLLNSGDMTSRAFLINCIIEYAGSDDGDYGNNNGAIYISETNSAYILQSIIRYSETSGVYSEASSSPFVQHCNITHCYNYGIYREILDVGYWISAKNTWWGNSTGPNDPSDADGLSNPSGLGLNVTNYVDYVDFRNTDEIDYNTDEDNSGAGDGLPDWYEYLYFKGTDSTDGSDDTDEDGVSDAVEFKIGTNPTDGTDLKGPGIYYEYDEKGRITKIMKVPSTYTVQ